MLTQPVPVVLTRTAADRWAAAGWSLENLAPRLPASIEVDTGIQGRHSLTYRDELAGEKFIAAARAVGNTAGQASYTTRRMQREKVRHATARLHPNPPPPLHASHTDSRRPCWAISSSTGLQRAGRSGTAAGSRNGLRACWPTWLAGRTCGS